VITMVRVALRQRDRERRGVVQRVSV
jgi:hypothetical protein